MLAARRVLHNPVGGGPLLKSFSTENALTFDSGQGAWALEIPKPSGVAAGSFLVAQVYFASSSATAIAAPSGWTNTDENSNGSASGNGGMYYHVAGSSEPTIYEFLCSNVPAAGVILNYSGASGVDAHSTHFSNVGVTAATVGSLTPSGANRTLVAAFCSFHGNSFTTPTGTTLEADVAASGPAASIYVFDERGIGSATGAINSTISASDGYMAFDALLHP